MIVYDRLKLVMYMTGKNKFQRIYKKYERSVYRIIGSLSKNEKKQEYFKLTLSQEKEILNECEKVLVHIKEKDHAKCIRKCSTILDGLSYLHHHLLDGNYIFTYALQICSYRWTVNYFKKKEINIEIPSEDYEIFLSFLTFLSEKGEDGKYLVQISLFEYYLFVLEYLGKIKKSGKNIYLIDQKYLKNKG